MDLTSADQWREALRVVWASPQVVVPLVLLFAAFAYWLGNRLGAAGKEGLREKNEALRERLALASDKEGAISGSISSLQADLASLRAEIDDLRPKVPIGTIETLSSTSASITTSFDSLETANTELREILSTADYPAANPKVIFFDTESKD